MLAIELGDVEIAGAFLIGFVLGIIITVRLARLSLDIVRREDRKK